MTMIQLKAHQVFVSHSSIDNWVAKQIAFHVEQCGAKTFLDAEDIDHGDDFDETIVDAADKSDELLVLITPWSKDRSYVWMEIGMFRGKKKRIVGVLHGLNPNDISTDEKIPDVLEKIDLVNLNEIDSYFEQLRRRVAQKGDGYVQEI